MSHLLDVVRRKNLISAMNFVDKIKHAHKKLSDIMNTNE